MNGGYDNGLIVPYVFAAQDFGAGSATRDIQGPPGLRGRILGLSMAATETFNAVSTPAHVLVGTAADTDAYLDYNVGELAAGAGVTKVHTGPDGDFDVLDDLPADTEARISLIAPSGGTPTGIADTTLLISWY